MSNEIRNRALLGLAAALVVAIGMWFFIDRATDRGLMRLTLIDRVWQVCDSGYASARNGVDTSRIDAQPLSEPVDSGKRGAPHRCGDMRRPNQADSAKGAEAVRSVMPTRDRR